MAIHKQLLDAEGTQLPEPGLTPLTGLQPMLRSPALAAMRGQDKIASLSRRIVVTSGLRGDTEWRVPNTSTFHQSLQTHPDNDTWYVVARGMVEVTPGCFYQLVGAFVPSGETMRYRIDLDPIYWEGDGPEGHVRVTVVWTDRSAATETTTHYAFLPGSDNEWGAENDDDGGLFTSLRNFKIVDIQPPAIASDDTELTRFSQHVTAEFTVEVRASPRIVDLAIHEVPVAVAFQDSDADDRWTSHVLAPGLPDNGVAPIRPVNENSATDQTGGTHQILRTARAQALRLGPCLVQWTAYTEEAADYNTTIIPVTTSNNGSNWRNLITGLLSAYDGDAEAGWSVSCGGYARRWAECNQLVLRDRIAVIPVLVRVYANLTTAGTATFRFQTAVHSYVDVPFAVAGADQWREAYGWLEVGITPEQRVTGQAFIQHVGATGSFNATALEVYYSSIAAVI